jgi:ATP-dependent exoDNAse (exonuclease V) alpha subunit
MIKTPVELEWNEGFREAVEWVQGSRESLFITGRAGSGKSTLLRYLKQFVLSDPVVLAPTGVAALAIGGQTVHGFFRFPPRVLFSWDEPSGRGEALRRLDTLVIDEISLMRADAFAAMENVLRRQGPQPGLPFGGVRLILFGDLHQLPPVLPKSEEEALLLEHEGPWFFQTRAFRKLRCRRIFLDKVYRQHDPLFLERLERARRATPSDEDLAAWNSRLTHVLDGSENPSVTLTSTNAIAAQRNAEAMASLPEPEICYEARFEGDFEVAAAPVPLMLALRVGAQVMFQRNHPERLWVNGTLGIVVGMEKESVWVVISGKLDTVSVTRETWRQIVYEEDPATGRLRERETGVYHQLPLKPAWAVTVHKSQGQEFDQVRIDLGARVFAHGQTYVALSRCRSFEGLSFHRPLRRDDFRLDPAVLEFLE